MQFNVCLSVPFRSTRQTVKRIFDKLSNYPVFTRRTVLHGKCMHLQPLKACLSHTRHVAEQQGSTQPHVARMHVAGNISDATCLRFWAPGALVGIFDLWKRCARRSVFLFANLYKFWRNSIALTYYFLFVKLIKDK